MCIGPLSSLKHTHQACVFNKQVEPDLATACMWIHSSCTMVQKQACTRSVRSVTCSLVMTHGTGLANHVLPCHVLVLLQARTIDLCNNPKTKEPKLQAARRIIKEWPGLDDEQAKFTDSVDAQFKAQEQEFAAAGGAAAAATASSPGGSADADDASDRTEL